jgi:hypothetical protein
MRRREHDWVDWETRARRELRVSLGIGIAGVLLSAASIILNLASR